MREIKFRVYSVNKLSDYYRGCDDNIEVYDLYDCNDAEEISDATRHRDIPKLDNSGHNVIFEQYTGLKDKNGVEIYEGDIVEFDAKEWGDNETNKHLISWNSKEASFCFGGGRNNENEFRTVVGNIHENSDLLPT